MAYFILKLNQITMALPIDKELILEKHCPSMSILYLDDMGRAFRKRILAAMEDHGDQLLHKERYIIQAKFTSMETGYLQSAQKLVEALEKIANNTAWQNWQAQEVAKTALQQWNAGKEGEAKKLHSGNKHQWQDDWDMDEQGELNEETKFEGSVITEPVPGIALGCISPEARDLLDTIMEKWEDHYKTVKTDTYEPTHYGFAYWLVRWSGLIQPAAITDRPCPHCGKELNRDRNLCCRECGKEVSNA